MRIALIDNMNNNFFSLFRFLLRESIDVHLYLTDSTSHGCENSHFLPENDTYCLQKYSNRIHGFPISYSWKHLYVKSKLELLRKELSDYDHIVACGFSLSFLFKAKINIDLFIPYGGDLFTLAAKPTYRADMLIRYFLYRRTQRDAIRSAGAVLCNSGHVLYDSALKSLGIKPIQYVIPMVFDEGTVLLDYRNDVWKFMENYDFIVFSHTRHVWKSNQGLTSSNFEKYGGNKRNDRLIAGFADFIRRTNSNSILVLFEYGPDVKESKQLIRDLSIEKNVRWIPKLGRKEVLEGIRASNVVVDQLREGIVGIGGSSLEGLALGKPVMTHTNNAINDASNGYYKAPFIDVISQSEICDHIEWLFRNPVEAKKIGKQGAIWYNKYSGRSSALKLLSIIGKGEKLNLD
ncbi:glycosyltransferase [Akkermansiaceae bacterium]|nr:glycosyltransferase [Akkermansiaceae bacterium]